MRKMRLVAGVVLAAAALAWSPAERVDRKPENYRTYLPCMAVGADGSLHAVWSESPESGFLQKVMYARRQGDTWTIPVSISRDSGDIRTPAIVVDSTGKALVVWSEESYARMRFVRQLGDTWSVPKLCFSSNGITPRLAVDGTGRVHLLYEEIGGLDAIWYSRYVPEGDTWDTPTLVADDSGVLGWSDMAVDAQDRLHAVWMNYGTDGIDYANNDGTGWTAPMALPDPAPDWQSTRPRIVVSAAMKPEVVWEERWGGQWVYYSQLVGDTWTTPYRVSTEEGARPAIATWCPIETDVAWGGSMGILHVTRPDTGTSVGALPGCLVCDSSTLFAIWRENWEVRCSRHTAAGISSGETQVALPASLRVATTPLGLRLRFTTCCVGEAYLRIVDSAGRTVLTHRFTHLRSGGHDVELSMRPMPSGTYSAMLATNHGPTEVVKIVISR
jgi:hypothetical protein